VMKEPVATWRGRMDASLYWGQSDRSFSESSLRMQNSVLPVGHTHEDVDRLFKLIWKKRRDLQFSDLQ
jgi:hypothetical protein